MRSKYRVATRLRRTYEGKVYASRAEMMYAIHLVRLLATGDVIEVVEQPRLWLGVRLNVYVPDFLVVPRLFLPYYCDVKGHETAAFRKNKRLWREYGRLDLHIVEVDRNGKPRTREVVSPEA